MPKRSMILSTYAATAAITPGLRTEQSAWKNTSDNNKLIEHIISKYKYAHLFAWNYFLFKYQCITSDFA
jgi:hypothetical protein